MTKRRHQFSDYPNIALSGKMGSGKTTLANYLVREYNYKLLHFAGPIKEAAATIFGHDKAHHNRGLLQDFGLLIRKEFGEDTWVEAMERAIAAHDSYEPLVIDDCRFPNEQNMLNKLSNWRFGFVTANTDQRYARLQSIKKIESREQMNHESERGMDQMTYDFYVPNLDSLDDLYHRQADKIIEKWARRV
jgi:cytidylate kinase